MKFFTDDLGAILAVDGPVTNDASGNGGLYFEPTGEVVTTVNVSGDDGFVSGFRVSRFGQLVVGDGDVAARPYVFIAGLPTDGRVGREGVLIRQTGQTPGPGDSFVAGVAVGPLGGVHMTGGGGTCIPVYHITSPVITGTGEVGTTLVLTNGTYGGTAPIDLTWIWNTGAASVIGGQTYDVLPSDVGVSISVYENATNACGSDGAGSNTIVGYGGSFTPTDLPLLYWHDISDLSTLWQDAARTIPVTADGDPVGFIDDKSGNGYNLRQVTATARPIYQTDGTYHWLEFDGADDMLWFTQVFTQNQQVELTFGIDSTGDAMGLLFSAQTGSVTYAGAYSVGGTSVTWNATGIAEEYIDGTSVPPMTEAQLSTAMLAGSMVYAARSAGLIANEYGIANYPNPAFAVMGSIYELVGPINITQPEREQLTLWIYERMPNALPPPFSSGFSSGFGS